MGYMDVERYYICGEGSQDARLLMVYGER